MIFIKRITKKILGLSFLGLLTFQSCKEYSPDEPFPYEFTPTIYTGTNNQVVYAIDVATGKYDWRTNVNGEVANTPLFEFNNLYVGTDNGFLYRIDYKNGAIQTETQLNGAIKGSPTVYDGKILVTAGNRVQTLDPMSLEYDPEQHFIYDAPGEIVGSVTIHEINNLEEGPYIFLATTNDRIIALNNEGQAIWTFIAPNGQGFESSPNVTNENYLYIGNNNGKLYNLHTHNGQLNWEFSTAGSIKSSPILIDGNVMFGSFDRKFYSVDSATGLERWHIQTEDAIAASPAYHNQKVYFGSHDHFFYCVDIIDGETIWKKTTFGLIQSSPVIYKEDVYFGSYDKNFYKLNAQDGSTQWIFNIQGQMKTSPIIRGMNETLYPSVSGKYPY